MKYNIWTLCICMLCLSCSDDKATLFEHVPTQDSGVTFSNRITETDKYNVLEYEYVYNGGGVGIGDFNTDGLQDIFFAGNMVPNQLYLNKGEFKFEDISLASGIAADDRWASSVQVVDINNDGLDDIHVTCMTYEDGQLRRNMMLVNQGLDADGVPTFVDMAEMYGIADSTNTTAAAFLDYDNDGDLDLFLAVNKMNKKVSPNTHRKKEFDGSSEIRDRLYRNDSSGDQIAFEEVSVEAGILYGGFSLGINVSDINEDGYKDIYVTNDYLTNDLMYINNGDGTFTDRAMEYLKHTSYSAMGNDIADLNNDGLPEIVALDMLPEDNFRRKTMLPNNNYTTYINNERFDYQHQYIRNTLQVNRGKSPDSDAMVFSETAMMSGVSATDWSWAPMIADFDLDGDRDIIATNGFPKDVTDRDFIDYNTESGQFVVQADLLKKIPSVKIKNYAYRNENEGFGEVPQFTNVTEEWGIENATFSNGGAYVDLDNDGDLDYVVNNINDSASIFRSMVMEQDIEQKKNWLKIDLVGPANGLDGQGAVVTIFYGDGEIQRSEHTPYRGYLSSVERGVHFGLGSVQKIDMVVVEWYDRMQVIENITSNQRLTVNYGNADQEMQRMGSRQADPIMKNVTDQVGIEFLHKESDYTDYNVQNMLMHKLSQYGPAISIADVNGDDLDDVYISGSHFNEGTFLLQSKGGTFTEVDLLPGESGDDKLEEELGSLFLDVDGDGDQDLYLSSGGYEFKSEDDSYRDRLYLNERGQYVLAQSALPDLKSSSSCVRAADYDQDGDLDLFVGGRLKPFEYPLPVSSYILQNDGKGRFTNVSDDVLPELNNVGMVCDALWTDYDNDGRVDLMLAGEWMPIQFYRNTGKKFELANELAGTTGWWNGIASADFDKDGDVDYVIGNMGENTLLQTSKDAPVGIYFTDFDQNESLDIFPTAYFPNKKGALAEFPYFGLGDMKKEVIKLKGLYPRHSMFGEEEIDDVLSKFPDAKVDQLTASTFQSSYIENLGDGTFKIQPLPREAQVAPIFGMQAADFNEDGHLDILAVGNDYGTEVGQGRQDALNGLMMLGDGNGNFTPQTIQESGIVVAGDAKSIARLENADGQSLYIVGQNRGHLQVYQQSTPQNNTWIDLQDGDQRAVITTAGGQTYVHEFYFGDSYLGQSSRKFEVPTSATSIRILSVGGEERDVTL